MHITILREELLDGSLCQEAARCECGLHLDKR